MSIPKQPKKTSVNVRTSTITNAFYASILPFNRFSNPNVNERLVSLGYSNDEIKNEHINCIYCGSEANTWDHLYPLIKKREVTGFYHDISNMVPSCNTCNSSKGSKDYKEWLSGNVSAKKRISEENRNKAIDRISKALEKTPVRNIREILSEVLSTDIGIQYTKDLELIIDLLNRSSKLSNQLREIISREL